MRVFACVSHACARVLNASASFNEKERSVAAGAKAEGLNDAGRCYF